MEKSLINGLTPTFAKVNGNFATEKDRYAAVQRILKASLLEHKLKLHRLVSEHLKISQVITTEHGVGAYNLVARLITKSLK